MALAGGAHASGLCREGRVMASDGGRMARLGHAGAGRRHRGCHVPRRGARQSAPKKHSRSLPTPRRALGGRGAHGKCD